MCIRDSLYAHFNFYFFKRNLQFRIGQGIAYTTNPYDRDDNFRNNAYGSRFLSSTFMGFNYHKENIYKNLGFKAGISIIHYSNANVKAPNTSSNTIAFNAGLVCTLEQAETEYIRKGKVKLTNPIKYNLVFRGGINASDNIGHGQYPPMADIIAGIDTSPEHQIIFDGVGELYFSLPDVFGFSLL